MLLMSPKMIPARYDKEKGLFTNSTDQPPEPKKPPFRHARLVKADGVRNQQAKSQLHKSTNVLLGGQPPASGLTKAFVGLDDLRKSQLTPSLVGNRQMPGAASTNYHGFAGAQ